VHCIINDLKQLIVLAWLIAYGHQNSSYCADSGVDDSTWCVGGINRDAEAVEGIENEEGISLPNRLGDLESILSSLASRDG